MSIIPDSDETLIVDQASVNGDGNGPLNSEADEPEADEDWGDIRRPPYAASSPRVGKAIDLADSGMSVEDLRAYGRWRSLDSAWAYVQRSPSYAKVRRLRSMTTGKE